MKRSKYLLLLALLFISINTQAQYQVVTSLVKRVIRAIDLKVQRMQNKTIWLQNAQKTLENELSKLRLAEISGWSEKQEKLYGDYYDELLKVRSAITYYQRVRDLGGKQVAMIREYQRAWQLFSSDRHFKPAELLEMERVYAGILDAAAKNIDQILLVTHPGKTRMTDQQRLEMIDQSAGRLDENYADLKRFNDQNMILTLHRSKDLNELQTLKNYYGLH